MNTQSYARTNASYPGKLIVVEGPDGVGKTDLVGGNSAEGFVGLVESLRQTYNLEVLALREPGGCAFSEHARQLLKGQVLSGALTSARAEALLFAAARAQLVEEVVRPALAAGTWVVLDRFVGSSIVYQGLARGLPVSDIKAVSEFATGGLRPHRVLALQASEDVAAQRRRLRDGETADRIEASTSAQVIRDGYAELKHLDPRELVEISADGDRQQTLELCLQALWNILPGAPDQTPAELADSALFSWLQAHPGARNFRAQGIVQESGLPSEEIELALARAVGRSELQLYYGVLCPDSGRTIKRYDGIDDLPLGEEFDCDDCRETHYVDEHLLWITYSVVADGQAAEA